MNYYTIWCNLRNSRQDLEFADAVAAYLGHLQAAGKIADWSLLRRKFGFGPDQLGEFQISIRTHTLDQLDQAFFAAAARDGELEQLHVRVYSMVTDFRSALYRDFPDAERVRP